MDERSRQLLALLHVYEPRDAHEQHSVGLISRYLTWLTAPFDPSSDPTHITASAIVLCADDAVVLHRHKRLGIYLQPGGHIEGDEAPEQAAARELHEETGLTLTAGPLVHVDVHQGPRGHVHLDLRYRFTFQGTPAFRPQPGESADVRVVPREWVMAHSETSLRRAVIAALDQR